MQTIRVALPECVRINQREVLLILAANLYEQGTLSIGQAAAVAGYSKRTFMEALGDYGVSVFNYAPEDLTEVICCDDTRKFATGSGINETLDACAGLRNAALSGNRLGCGAS